MLYCAYKITPNQSCTRFLKFGPQTTDLQQSKERIPAAIPAVVQTQLWNTAALA